jgi:hypothetical protein
MESVEYQLPNDASQYYSPDMIAETQRVWSKQYGREISTDEAIEMLRNVKALARVLLPLAEAEIAERKKVQNSKPGCGAETGKGIPDGEDFNKV